MGVVFACVAVHYGLGRHQYYLLLTPELASEAAKWQWLLEIIAGISFMFIRISICLFVLRIFGITRRLRWTLYTAIAFIVATNISSTLIFVLQCQPPQKVWKPLTPGTCLGPKAVLIGAYYNGGRLIPRA